MQTRNTSESDFASRSKNIQKSKHQNFKDRNIHEFATCSSEHVTEQDHTTQSSQ